MSAALHVIATGGDGPAEGVPAAAPPRARVADLPASRRLLLWSLRLLAENHGNWGVVQQELWLCCGIATVESVLKAIEDLLETLAVEGRRPFLVKPSEARRMTACEEALLALIAAAEDDEEERVAAHARWLVRPIAQADLMAQAARLAQGFPGSDLRGPFSNAP